MDEFNELKDEVENVRIKTDGTVSDSAGNAIREQITELNEKIGNKIGNSINIVDVFKDMTIVGRLNLITGVIDESVTTWRTSEFIKVDSSIKYSCIKFNSEEWIRHNGNYIAFYDITKKFIQGEFSSSSKDTSLPINCYYIRISIEYVQFKYTPMVCKSNDAKNIIGKTNPKLFSDRFNYFNDIDDDYFAKYSKNYLDINNLEKGRIDTVTGELDKTMVEWVTTQFINIHNNEYDTLQNFCILSFYDGTWDIPDNIYWVGYDKNKELVAKGTSGYINSVSAIRYIRLSFDRKMYKYYVPTMILGCEEFTKKLYKSNKLALYESNESLSNFTIELLIPDIIPVVEGKEFQLFYDNVTYGYNAFKANDKKIYGLDGYENFAFYKPTSSDPASKQCTYMLFTDKTGAGWIDISENIKYVSAAKDFIIKKVSPTAGNGVTRNVMLFGDSITAYGYYPQELKTLFNNDQMNINLIGTLGMSGKSGNLHEGRGGWSAYDYLSRNDYLGYTNAFWNPSSNKFDFTYYMDNNNFTSIDDFIMMLGINDINVQSYDEILNSFEEIITSVRKFNNNCKIFICLCLVPSQMEYSKTSGNKTNQKEKNRRLGLWKEIINKYDNRNSEEFYVVPVGACIDSLHDFPTETRVLSDRNTNITIDYCTDNTHPTISGFNKIADMIYNYLKYSETN